MNKKLITMMVAMSFIASCGTTTVNSVAGRPALTKEEAALMPEVIGGNDVILTGEAPPASPSEIKISVGEPAGASEIGDLRKNAVTEGALSYGAQMGYARGSWEIMERIQARSGVLSQVFDFNKVVARGPSGTGIIVPPVIISSTRALTVNASGTEAASADAYLLISKPGRITSVTPTWRDYLVMNVSVPEKPARSLLPVNKNEANLFNAKFDEGWRTGREQAETEFADRIARLQRDFHGMLQYQQLVANGMMDRMVLANADFGVTANEREMRIGSKAVKITSEAEFNANPKTWSVKTVSQKGILVQNNGSAPTLGNMLH